MDKLTETFQEAAKSKDQEYSNTLWLGMRLGYRVAMTEAKQTIVQLANRRK